MKLVSFSVQTEVGQFDRIGSLIDNTIIDLTAGHSQLLSGKNEESDLNNCPVLPTEMIEFLSRGKEAIETAKDVVAFISETSATRAPNGARLRYDLEDVSIQSPVPRPASIRDCSVYEGHLLNTRGLESGELPDVYYDYPIYYNGSTEAIVAPDSRVSRPVNETRFDYELEIAAVIGKQGTNIPAKDADEYIAGYTIFNDFSARDHQLETKPLMLGPGKSKDFVSGLGPCLVTSDAIDPTELNAITRVNGEVWAEGDTGGMYHPWDQIIEYISSEVTIHPGDVIGSGTIENGCGLERGQWLEPGDTIELEVEQIGTLQHTVGEMTE